LLYSSLLLTPYSPRSKTSKIMLRYALAKITFCLLATMSFGLPSGDKHSRIIDAGLAKVLKAADEAAASSKDGKNGQLTALPVDEADDLVLQATGGVYASCAQVRAAGLCAQPQAMEGCAATCHDGGDVGSSVPAQSVTACKENQAWCAARTIPACAGVFLKCAQCNCINTVYAGPPGGCFHIGETCDGGQRIHLVRSCNRCCNNYHLQASQGSVPIYKCT